MLRAMMRARVLLTLSSMLLWACASSSRSPATNDPEFEERFAALSDGIGVLVVKPGDDASAAFGSSSLGLTKSRREKRTMLTSNDILRVVRGNMKDVKGCYEKQLDEDPEWAGDLILDISVQQSGQVSEVGVSPRRVARATMGRCLVDVVPGWSFPEFTGVGEDGMVQQVANASLPLSFAVR